MKVAGTAVRSVGYCPYCFLLKTMLMLNLNSSRKRNYTDTVPAELVCEVWAGEQHKEQTSLAPFNPDNTKLSASPFHQSTSASFSKPGGFTGHASAWCCSGFHSQDHKTYGRGPRANFSSPLSCTINSKCSCLQSPVKVENQDSYRPKTHSSCTWTPTSKGMRQFLFERLPVPLSKSTWCLLLLEIGCGTTTHQCSGLTATATWLGLPAETWA